MAINENTKILPCKCDHDYQDKKYGPHMRLMNLADQRGKSPGRYRCTVCGSERQG